jgi:hypothetical protein
MNVGRVHDLAASVMYYTHVSVGLLRFPSFMSTRAVGGAVSFIAPLLIFNVRVVRKACHSLFYLEDHPQAGIWSWSTDRVKFSLPNVGKGVKIFRVITGTEWITPLDAGRQSTPKNINKIYIY